MNIGEFLPKPTTSNSNAAPSEKSLGKRPLREESMDDDGFRVPQLPGKATKMVKLSANGSSSSKNIPEESASPESRENQKLMRKWWFDLDRAFVANQQQRQLHPDDPTKFMESEVALSTALDQALSLAAYPQLYGTLLSKPSGSSLIGDSAVSGNSFVTLLGQLLLHDNTDISIQTLRLLQELTDDDTIDAATIEESNAASAGMKLLIEALIPEGIVKVMVDLLPNLNEDNEDDAAGVFSALSVIESIFNYSHADVITDIIETTDVLAYLVHRVSMGSAEVDANRQYSAEILSIVFQRRGENTPLCFDRDTFKYRHTERKANEETPNVIEKPLDTMEILLQSLAIFKKTDPSTGEEEEFMENLFDCLVYILSGRKTRQLFLESEGVELMMRMMKEGNMSSMRAWQILRAAMGMSETNYSGEPTSFTDQICQRFVEIGGLKYLFFNILGKNNRQLKKAYGKSFNSLKQDDQSLAILRSLFANLTPNPPKFYLLRLLFKFCEKSFAAVDRLVEMFMDHVDMLRVADIEAEILADPYSFETGPKDIRSDHFIIERMSTHGNQLEMQYQLAIVFAELLFRAPLLHDLMEDEDNTKNVHSHLLQTLKRNGVVEKDILLWIESYLRVLAKNIEDLIEIENPEPDDPVLESLKSEIKYCQRFFVLANQTE